MRAITDFRYNGGASARRRMASVILKSLTPLTSEDMTRAGEVIATARRIVLNILNLTERFSFDAYGFSQGSTLCSCLSHPMGIASDVRRRAAIVSGEGIRVVAVKKSATKVSFVAAADREGRARMLLVIVACELEHVLSVLFRGSPIVRPNVCFGRVEKVTTSDKVILDGLGHHRSKTISNLLHILAVCCADVAQAHAVTVEGDYPAVEDVETTESGGAVSNAVEVRNLS